MKKRRWKINIEIEAFINPKIIFVASALNLTGNIE